MTPMILAFDVGAVLADSLRTGLGPNGAVFALACIGLNLHYGYTGMLNFGHVGFMAAGSYGVAITITQGGPFWLGILVGLLAAAVFALLIGIPTLRLRGDFLAITTIAAGEILRVTLRSGRLEDVTGGVFGLPRPVTPSHPIEYSLSDQFYSWSPFSEGTYSLTDVAFIGDLLEAVPGVGPVLESAGMNERSMWVAVVGWSLVALCATLIWALMRSPWGRVLRAIREDEDAARAVGKNAFVYKLQSLVIGGTIGGLAGMVRTMDFSFAHPESFKTQTTFFLWTALILGGAATIKGPIVGAIAFWFTLSALNGILSGLASDGLIPSWLMPLGRVSTMRFVLVGLTLAALMIWRPQGLLGKKEESMLDAA